MASYTISDATWSNNTTAGLRHRVTFTPITTRPVAFVGCWNSENTNGRNLIGTGTPGNWTSSTIADPTNAYFTSTTGRGNSNVLYTCTGATTNGVGFTRNTAGNSPWGDAGVPRVVDGGATKLFLWLYTEGNTGAWSVRVQKAAAQNTDDQIIALPSTPNGWNWLELDLPTTRTVVTSHLSITGSFTTNNRVSMSTAYVANDSTLVIKPGDTISPDGGITNFTVDKIVNNNNNVGAQYVIYVQEPSSFNGVFSTLRTEPSVGQARDFTATVSASASTSSAVGYLRQFASLVYSYATTFTTGTIISKAFHSAVSTVASVLPTINTGPFTPKYLNSTVSATSTSGGDTTITPGISEAVVGQATWTNGSNTVVFTSPNLNIYNIEASTPWTLPNEGGGKRLAANTTNWGRSSTGSYVYSSTRRATGLTYANPHAVPRTDINTPDNGFIIQRRTEDAGPTHSIAGMTRLNLASQHINNTPSNQLSVYVRAVGDNTIATPDKRTVLPTSNDNTWLLASIGILSPLGTALSNIIVDRHSGSNYNLSMIIDSVFLTNNDPTAIQITDGISRSGDPTKYRILKLLQSANGTITLILDKAYTGATGTYDTIRYPDYGWRSRMTIQSGVQATALTRLQELIANLYTQSGVQGAISRVFDFAAPITSGSAITSTTTYLKALTSAVGASAVVQGTTDLVKAFGSTIQSSSAVSALEYIKFRFMTATSNATAAVQSNVGRIWDLASNIDAAATISSFRTRLQLYTSTVTGPAQSVVVSFLGHAKLMTGAVIDGISSLTSNKADVARGITTQIDAVSAVDGTLYRSIDYLSATIAGSGLDATPSFVVGFSAPVDATSSQLPGNITLAQALNAIVAGSGAVNISGEFLPVSLFSAIVDGSGNISAHFIRTVPIDGSLLATSSVSPTIGVDKGMTANTAGFSSLTSRITVPDHIRKLIVESSGVVIAGDGSNVVFNEITKSYEVVVKGISIIQFDDLTNPQKQTIVVLE